MSEDFENEQQDGQFELCLERFEQMLARNDHYYFDVDEIEELIEHYMCHFELDKAMKALELADQQHPHIKEFELRRADILAMQGNTDAALRSIALIESIDPANVDVLLMKGSIYSRQGKHRKAISTYREALRHSPDNTADIRIMISCDMQALGRNQEAMEQLKTGLLENPGEIPLLYEIGFLYDRMGQTEEGMAFFKRILEEQPYDVSARFNLAMLCVKTGKLKQAVWELELCLAVDDSNTMFMFELAQCFQELGEWDKAEEQYREMLAVFSDCAEAMVGLAQCSDARGELDAAFSYYQSAAKMEPDYPEAWYGMAVVYEKKGLVVQAMQALSKAIESDSTDPEFHYFLGDLLERSGKPNDASESFKHACEIAPEEPRYRIAHAQTLFHQFDSSLGIETMADAIKSIPECAELHYRMAAFLLMNGQRNDAFYYLQNGLEMDFEGRTALFDEYPEADADSKVTDLIGIYGQQ